MALSSEIIAKLGLDSSAFSTGLGRAGRQAEQFSTTTSRGMGGVIGTMGKLVTVTSAVRAAFASLLGLAGALTAPALADALARWITGFSKSAEKALDDLVEKTGKAADEAERRRDKARTERESKEAAAAAATAASELRQWELVRDFRIKAAAEVAEEERKRQSDIAEATQRGLERSVDLDQQLWRQKVDRLPTEEKIAALEREKAELLAVQKTTVKGSNDFKELALQIGTLDNEIAAERKALAEQTARAEKQITEEKREQVSIGITGRGNRELSDRELERKRQQLNNDLFSSSLGQIGRIYVGNPFGVNPLDYMRQRDLADVQAELALRNRTRRRADFVGEDRAFRESAFAEERFRQILESRPPSTDERTASAIEKLERTLRRPLQVVPVGPG